MSRLREGRVDLITNPNEAKVELAMDEPCTRREVAQYVGNHTKNVLIPPLTNLAQEMQALGKMQHIIGERFNFLVDFMEKIGLRESADGRFYLNPQEFQAFCAKQKQIQEQGTKPAA